MIDFDIPPGWHCILHTCFLHLLKLGQPIEFAQIKSKFGGLRLYAYDATPEQQVILNTFEIISLSTCETCGDNRTVEQRTVYPSNWIRTLCYNCYNKEREDRMKECI